MKLKEVPCYYCAAPIRTTCVDDYCTECAELLLEAYGNAAVIYGEETIEAAARELINGCLQRQSWLDYVSAPTSSLETLYIAPEFR